MTSFDELMTRFSWKPIPRCDGRYVLSGGLSDLSPAALAGPEAEVREFQSGRSRDPVLVVNLDKGSGLISYRQPDGRYVHTLNTAEGFARKLQQLHGQ
jgi:hypothetical protein